MGDTGPDRGRPAAPKPAPAAASRPQRATSRLGSSLPAWLRVTVAYCAAGLVLVVAGWILLQLLVAVRVVTFAVIGALLLAAVLSPLSRWMARAGAPRWVAGLTPLLLLLGVLATSGYFIVRRTLSQLGDLQGALAAGVSQLRSYFTGPPLSLNADRLDQIRDIVVGRINEVFHDPLASAAFVLEVLSSVILALFLLFFLLKDGAQMWQWIVRLVPPQRRERVDGAGRRGWWTLTRYVVGSVVIALIDAVSIGVALYLIGVPLALSLALLIFFSSFVPILGATVSGAAAVLVTLVSLGLPEALLVLGVVVLVQQLEGNLLQPVVMGRAVELHPVVILVAVSSGGLLAGIPGAVVAVPLTAVSYQVIHYLADPDAEPGDPVRRAGPDGATS